MIVDTEVSLDCSLFSILDVQVDGRLEINTTDVEVTSSSGNKIAANSFYLDVSGSLDLLGVLTIQGQVTVDVDQNDWTIVVPNASVDFFGIGYLQVSGAINSEGEFSINVNGGVSIGVAGSGLFGTGSLVVSNQDDNGTELGGNQNYVLYVSGYFDVSVQLFGVTLVGAHLDASYDQGSGHISVVAGVDVLWWTYYYRFSVGYLKTPPTIYLAGNSNDTTGTDFVGGELYLNMGPRASYRNLASDEINEFFTVEYVGPSGPSESDGHTVRVHGMGRKADYQGVTKIIADGGDGADYVRIMWDVPVPVEFQGGADTDCLAIAGDDSPNDLRVTMDDDNVVWVSSYSNNSETGSVKLDNVESIRLLGGEGADQFSISGELDLGGVTTGVTVDLGSLTDESEQLPDGEVDTVALTLGPGADDFELEPTDTGFQGTWKSHFTLDVPGGLRV